jgi:hypothetical protein
LGGQVCPNSHSGERRHLIADTMSMVALWNAAIAGAEVS